MTSIFDGNFDDEKTFTIFLFDVCVDTRFSAFFVVKQFMGHTHNFRLFFFLFSNERTAEKAHNLTRTEYYEMRVCELWMWRLNFFFTKCFKEIKSFYSPIYLYSSLHYTIRAFLNVCNSYQKIYNWVVSLSLSLTLSFFEIFSRFQITLIYHDCILNE